MSKINISKLLKKHSIREVSKTKFEDLFGIDEFSYKTKLVGNSEGEKCTKCGAKLKLKEIEKYKYNDISIAEASFCKKCKLIFLVPEERNVCA